MKVVATVYSAALLFQACYSNPGKEVLWFLKWRSWSSEGLNDLPQVTELEDRRILPFFFFFNTHALSSVQLESLGCKSELPVWLGAN